MRMLMSFIFMINVVCYSFELENLSAKFTCIKAQNCSSQTITGRITFQKPSTALIITDQPQKQLVFISDKKMTIYSKESNKAFVFISQSNIAIPYLSDFLAATMEDFGLSKSGLTIKNISTFDDTLVTIWQTSKEVTCRQISLYSINDAIVKITSCSHDNKGQEIILFSDHLTAFGYVFPLKIEIFDSTKTRLKMTTLDSVLINSPDMTLLELPLPANASIKEYKW